MVKRFRDAVPFETPLCFRVRSITVAAPFEWTVTWALGRRVGAGVFRHMKDLVGGYPWEREANDVLFELHVDKQYRKLLTVGGSNPDEAAQNWGKVATAMRTS